MFLVFNKEKISAYIILLSTVVILFGLAFSITSNDTVATSSNIISKENKISDIIENTLQGTSTNDIEEKINIKSENIINHIQMNMIVDE